MTVADEIVTAAFMDDTDALMTVIDALSLREARAALVELASAIQIVTIAYIEDTGGDPSHLPGLWADFLLDEADPK